ncbi:unnamed protein product [Malus baccata var. baccata]
MAIACLLAAAREYYHEKSVMPFVGFYLPYFFSAQFPQSISALLFVWFPIPISAFLSSSKLPVFLFRISPSVVPFSVVLTFSFPQSTPNQYAQMVYGRDAGYHRGGMSSINFFEINLGFCLALLIMEEMQDNKGCVFVFICFLFLEFCFSALSSLCSW